MRIGTGCGVTAAAPGVRDKRGSEMLILGPTLAASRDGVYPESSRRASLRSGRARGGAGSWLDFSSVRLFRIGRWLGPVL